MKTKLAESSSDTIREEVRQLMAPLRAGNLVPTIAALPPAAMLLVTPPKIPRLRPKPRTLAWVVVIRLPSPPWKEDKLSSTWDPVQDLIVS